MAIAVAIVMIVVVASYRQNVHAYPSGGGDYEVATVNLGPNAGLTVGSALVDYVLTVAVSVTSAAENIGSAIPFVGEHKVWFCVGAIMLLAAVNLRGIKESGAFLAIPTYGFIIGVLGMLIWGFTEIFVLGQDIHSETADFGIVPEQDNLTGLALVFLVARSFSSGCAALTGVEAISNGVPAFRKPKSRNAATTLMLLGAFSITLLLGIVLLAEKIGAKYVMNPGAGSHRRARGLSAEGDDRATRARGVRLVPTRVLRRHRHRPDPAAGRQHGLQRVPRCWARYSRRTWYLPRQLQHTRGDRLAFSNGILFLAIAAIIFVVAFGAQVTALIQLYIVGVFVSFTLSQTGMVRHWTRLLRTETDPSARRRMMQSRVVNTVGLVMTATVLVVVLLTKFTEGAYIAVIAMVVLFVIMKLIHHHYASVQRELDRAEEDDEAVLPSRTHSIVLVSSLHMASACPAVRAGDPAGRPRGDHGQRRRPRHPQTRLGMGGQRHHGAAEGHRVAVPRDHPSGRRIRAPGAPRVAARRGHRVHPGVRRRTLVGADPAQSVGAAPQGTPAVRTRRHGDLGAVAAHLVGPAQGRPCVLGAGGDPPRTGRTRTATVTGSGSPRRVEVTVDRSANGGEAVGRADGRVVFVRGAILGERVVAEITDDRHDSYWRADAVDVLAASPHRVPSPCPAASAGAGCCDLGHVAPDHARDLKQAVLLDVLDRVGHLPRNVVASTELATAGVRRLGDADLAGGSVPAWPWTGRGTRASRRSAAGRS